MKKAGFRLLFICKKTSLLGWFMPVVGLEPTRHYSTRF
jgi:hypothetical protein